MYKAQLTSLSSVFLRLEWSAIQRILHLATNALSHAALLHLPIAGGPSLTSFQVSAKAAMFRTAASTIPNWSAWTILLRKSTHEHLPLALHCLGLVSSPFLDDLTFAIQLENAWLGYRSDPAWDPAGLSLIQEIKTKCVGLEPQPGLLPFGSIQKIAYKALHTFVPPSDLHTIVLRFMSTLIPPGSQYIGHTYIYQLSPIYIYSLLAIPYWP